MAPFPLIKLGYLAVKQISKPIANYIKRKAKSNPFVRRFICIPPAQVYHWMEVNFRLRLMGLGRAKNIERLSDKEAIELGGEMLGESLVFFFASLILLSEYQRSARKDQLKEEKLLRETRALNAKIEELRTVADIQESQILDLQRKIERLPLPVKIEESEKKDGFVQRIFGTS